MFKWLIKRLFSDENLGYILEKVQPSIEEEIKISIHNILSDKEFHETTLAPVLDGYFARYRQKAFGAMGGLQKGLNSAVDKATPKFDFFDDDGRLSIRKIIPAVLQGGLIPGLGTSNQGQNRTQTTKEGSNAPNM